MLVAVLICGERRWRSTRNSAPLNAIVGLGHCADARFGWWDPRDVALEKSRSYTEKALQDHRDNPDAQDHGEQLLTP